jgi:hypothetical protein
MPRVYRWCPKADIALSNMPRAPASGARRLLDAIHPGTQSPKTELVQ